MKFLIIILGLYGAYWYIAKHFEFHDTLVYAKKNPTASWAPAADYYVGLIYYQRTDYPKAEEAFSQLLTDFPTTQYLEPALFYYEDSAEFDHNWDQAKTLTQQYLDAFPNGKNIEVMRKRQELLNYQHGGADQGTPQ